MNATLNITGGLLVFFGAIWFLQGINVLPGSFMTGQIRWAVYGGIATAAPSAVAANRSSRASNFFATRTMLGGSN